MGASDMFGVSSSSAGGGLFGKPGEQIKELDPSCFYTTPLDQFNRTRESSFSGYRV